jgi:hypothetical protein
MEINNLLEDARGTHKVMLEDSAKLAEKWQASGLLEGLEGKKAANMAVILENQAKQVVAEANTNTQGGATFTAGTGENWAGVALPLVRKVFAQIVAQDFVSVQPMSLPSGLVFYLDFKYGDSSGNKQDGDNMYGNVTEGATKMIKDQDVSGGLYGAGQFGYSINNASVSDVSAVVTGSTLAEVGFDAEFNTAGYESVVVDLDGLDADFLAARAFALEVGGNIVSTKPEFTSVDGTTVKFIVAAGVVADGSTPKIIFSKQTKDNDRGDFEAASGRAVDGSISIPEIDVKLQSEAIVAKTRKLKAQWTPICSRLKCLPFN